MKVFTVTAGAEHYSGLFASSFDAVLDAMDRFPGASRITAKVAA